MRKQAAFLLATWFGAGLSPVAPGTMGSIAALLFALPIYWLHLSPLILFAAAAFLLPIGIWASGIYAKEIGAEDPGSVVIDEVAGQWMVLALAPLTPLGWLAAFALFRLFDILKPWPVSWADRTLDGGTGIMMDDILAGLYGMAVMALATHFLF